MKINNCYIISWFGRDPDLRERRRRMHQTQIEWCHKHSLHPVVFAQEYEDGDYLDGVTYIRNEGAVLHPGPARNVLLKHFYQTDDDYAVFADNDIVNEVTLNTSLYVITGGVFSVTCKYFVPVVIFPEESLTLKPTP